MNLFDKIDKLHIILLMIYYEYNLRNFLKAEKKDIKFGFDIS